VVRISGTRGGTPVRGSGFVVGLDRDKATIVTASHVIEGAKLEVLPGQEPTLSLEIETPQDLHLKLASDFELVADFVQPDGVSVPFPGDLQTYRAKLKEANRTFDITSGERGLVLIVTPVRDQLANLFADPLDFPLASVEVLQEELEGKLTSPLRDKITLRYPDDPAVPAVIIEKGKTVGLGGLSQARLSSLEFDPKLDPEKGGALRASFEGIVDHAASRSGEFTSDHRLTLFDTFRYSRPWGLVAVVGAWRLSTNWAALGVWKKAQE
jgi:hypothetical protein